MHQAYEMECWRSTDETCRSTTRSAVERESAVETKWTLLIGLLKPINLIDRVGTIIVIHFSKLIVQIHSYPNSYSFNEITCN